MFMYAIVASRLDTTILYQPCITTERLCIYCGVTEEECDTSTVATTPEPLHDMATTPESSAIMIAKSESPTMPEPTNNASGRGRLISSVRDPLLMSIPVASVLWSPAVLPPSAALPMMVVAILFVWATHSCPDPPEVTVSAPDPPKAATEAVPEPFACPVTTQEVVPELSDCFVTATEAVTNLLSLTVLSVLLWWAFAQPWCS